MRWLALLVLVTGCGLLPPVAAPGDAQAVVERDRWAYVALGARGLGVVDLSTGAERVVPPPAGFGSVDDVALADGLLFALDAAPPGRLACLSLLDPAAPALVGPSRPVPVGPFSGVSAAEGRVAVSGGTSALTLHAYDRRGLGAELARLELGRGQPDVLVAGDRAYVATHFSLLRATYGLTVLDLAGPRVRGALELDGAGFTPGATKPAGFPLGLALAGPDRLLIAHGAGLAVVDVRDPDAPRLLDLLDLGLAGVSVAARGELAAVVGETDEGCAVVFVDLATREELGRERLPGARPGRCAFAGAGQLLVAGQAGGTIVLEPNCRWCFAARSGRRCPPPARPRRAIALDGGGLPSARIAAQRRVPSGP